MDIRERKERFDKFMRGPLRDASDRNPMVRIIAEQYALGQILHYEEALAQMVVHLEQHNFELRNQQEKLLTDHYAMPSIGRVQ